MGVDGGAFRPADLGKHRGKDRRDSIGNDHEWLTLLLKGSGKPWTRFACLSPIQSPWKRIEQLAANPLPRCYKIGEAHGGVCWVPGRMEREATRLLGTRDPRVADPGENVAVVGLLDPMAEAPAPPASSPSPPGGPFKA